MQPWDLKWKGISVPLGYQETQAITLRLGFLNWVQTIVGHFNALLYFQREYCHP